METRSRILKQLGEHIVKNYASVLIDERHYQWLSAHVRAWKNARRVVSQAFQPAHKNLYATHERSSLKVGSLTPSIYVDLEGRKDLFDI